jgi:hypothetical protein
VLPTNISATFGYNNDIRQGAVNGTLYGTMNGMCVVSAEISPADGIEETLFSCTETLIFASGPYQGSSVTIAGEYTCIYLFFFVIQLITSDSEHVDSDSPLRFDCLKRLYQGSPVPMAGVLLFLMLPCFSYLVSD